MTLGFFDRLWERFRGKGRKDRPTGAGKHRRGTCRPADYRRKLQARRKADRQQRRKARK